MHDNRRLACHIWLILTTHADGLEHVLVEQSFFWTVEVNADKFPSRIQNGRTRVTTHLNPRKMVNNEILNALRHNRYRDSCATDRITRVNEVDGRRQGCCRCVREHFDQSKAIKSTPRHSTCSAKLHVDGESMIAHRSPNKWTHGVCTSVGSRSQIHPLVFPRHHHQRCPSLREHASSQDWPQYVC